MNEKVVQYSINPSRKYIFELYLFVERGDLCGCLPDHPDPGLVLRHADRQLRHLHQLHRVLGEHLHSDLYFINIPLFISPDLCVERHRGLVSAARGLDQEIQRRHVRQEVVRHVVHLERCMLIC